MTVSDSVEKVVNKYAKILESNKQITNKREVKL